MAIPNLQVALDHNRIEDALKDALAVGNEVDIIEAGTILLLNEGDKAIKCLRSAFPDKVIIADTKCADAGTTVAKNVALAGATWTESDLNKIRRLIDMGFKVSATGGLTKDTLKVFEGIPIYTFIAGRGIYATENPAQSAREFKEEIKRIWG